MFNWLESRREYVTEDCHLYTRLVSMFARQRGGLDTAMYMFDRMQARGIKPDTVAFNSAITVAGERLFPVHSVCRLQALEERFDSRIYTVHCLHEGCSNLRIGSAVWHIAYSVAGDAVSLPSQLRPGCCWLSRRRCHDGRHSHVQGRPGTGKR